ncbi:hypothetical protein PVK06_042680 [Gossypium arboreum]|uniref:Uncharacterized protein n=1 Tax=Gossypium arboreum TaxID=29729 RepID=A0ABR0MLF8_GOSAR|nr:hypothetical protein PVK06_042680 [Gossypium arboreum]
MLPSCLTPKYFCCGVRFRGRGSEPVMNVQRLFHGGQMMKWGSFDAFELAQFVEHVEKPVSLKPWWSSEAFMENLGYIGK